MPQSLSKVYVHIIFSTKHRQKNLNGKIDHDLFNYIGGICKGLECYPVQIGGYQNHVHILCTLSRKITQIELVQELKQSSSKWIKTKGKEFSDFYWQDGYGIFSVNPSQVNVVIRYIQNQKKHHRKMDFEDELRRFLKKYHIKYDERYLLD